METSTLLTSTCLCKGVKIEAIATSLDIGVCHCDMCRQWAGSPFFAIEGHTVKLTGDTVNVYDSSDWAERGFCSHCGTHLFYRLKTTNTHYLPVGLFPQQPAMQLSHQIFIESKPNYYSFEQTTICMTGAEVMAQFEGDEPV